MSETPEKKERTWTEQIEIAGRELINRIHELIQEGNVRRLIIRNEKGEALLEVPLTAGVVVGGVLTMFAPVWAALGALAALLARVKIDIVRVEDKGEEKEEE